MAEGSNPGVDARSASGPGTEGLGQGSEPEVRIPGAGLQIAVLGAAECSERLEQFAFATGEALARSGAHLICGGRGGVMAAASRGARSEGGTAIGILPGSDARESPANDAVSVAVYTGMGQARNASVVLSAAAAIAIHGGWGTLSEIALALKHRIPVIVLESWSLSRPDGRDEPLLRTARSPHEAVELALEMADRERLGLPGEKRSPAR